MSTSRANGLKRGLVVFVVPDFEPTLGGTTRQTANQAGALLERGYDALVLTQRIDRTWPRREERDGLRIVRIGPHGRGSVAMKLVDTRVALWLWRRRRDIAIVHVVMYPDFAIASAAAGCGRRTVMVWAGLGDASDTLGRGRVATDLRWLRPALRVVRAGRRRVLVRRHVRNVALTDALADEVAGVLGSAAPRAQVIPTPVDIDDFRPPDPGERTAARTDLGLTDEISVVFAGHLRESKRIDRLIDAVALLRDGGARVRLYVLGDARPELEDVSEALHRRAADAGLADEVVFTGGVPDIRPYLWAADAFVLPSDREGLSNALLEALACGVPCVAPASAGGDHVLDDTCGAVPESGNPDSLAAAIAAVAEPTSWTERSRGARERAQRYSIAAVTGDYERLYAAIGVAGFDRRP